MNDESRIMELGAGRIYQSAMSPTEIVGFSAALLGAIHMVPQFVKSITTKSVQDVSLFMIILYFFATGLWTIYGYMANSLPVLFGDGFNFLVTLAQLVVKLKYEKDGKNFRAVTQ